MLVPQLLFEPPLTAVADAHERDPRCVFEPALVRVYVAVRDLYARKYRIGSHSGLAVRALRMPDEPPVRLRRGAAGAGVLFLFHGFQYISC